MSESLNSAEAINKHSKNEQIENYLREQYAFRYNTVKSRTEYRKAEDRIFQPVTKYCLNSIRTLDWDKHFSREHTCYIRE